MVFGRNSKGMLDSKTWLTCVCCVGDRDFPFADEDKVPEIRMITGIRQDKERLVQTFISSNKCGPLQISFAVQVKDYLGCVEAFPASIGKNLGHNGPLLFPLHPLSQGRTANKIDVVQVLL